MGTHAARVDDTRAALDAIRRIVQTLRQGSRWAERHVGLSGAQLFVLQKLAESPAMSLNELAARTRTHQSSVSTVVSRLVASRFVRRARSAEDRRTLELSLAPRGRQLLARAPGAPQDRLIRAIERLSGSRRRLLASALTELAQQMDDKAGVPSMFFEERARGGNRLRPRARKAGRRRA